MPASARSTAIRAAPAPSSSGRRTSGALQKTYFSSKDQLLTLALGASLDAKVVQAAREAGVPAVMHYRVNPAPGLALGKAGVLREGDLFIHTHASQRRGVAA